MHCDVLSNDAAVAKMMYSDDKYIMYTVHSDPHQNVIVIGVI